MDAHAAIVQLQQPRELSIIKLAATHLQNDEALSTKSSDPRANTSPALLASELAHYQELFSKLRFSYVEQVTKERFLRAITANPPDLIDAAENAQLEKRLAAEKSQLKERKIEVRELVQELEAQARQLAKRHEGIELETADIEKLPNEIADLEATVATLQQSRGPRSQNPALALPLQPTLDLLSERESHLDNLRQQIEALRTLLPSKQAELAAREEEVSMLHKKRTVAVEEAKDAQRRKEKGGASDELDERGRWLRGVDAGLRTMLEV